MWPDKMKKSTPLSWREAHFEVKMYKARHSRTTFGSSDVEKLRLRPLLEVRMSKNGTPLRHGEADCEVKMYKTILGPNFGSWDVKKWHAAVARRTCPTQNVV